LQVSIVIFEVRKTIAPAASHRITTSMLLDPVYKAIANVANVAALTWPVSFRCFLYDWTLFLGLFFFFFFFFFFVTLGHFYEVIMEIWSKRSGQLTPYRAKSDTPWNARLKYFPLASCPTDEQFRIFFIIKA
jgi:hypothetical protein